MAQRLAAQARLLEILMLRAELAGVKSAAQFDADCNQNMLLTHMKHADRDLSCINIQLILVLRGAPRCRAVVGSKSWLLVLGLRTPPLLHQCRAPLHPAEAGLLLLLPPLQEYLGMHATCRSSQQPL